MGSFTYSYPFSLYDNPVSWLLLPPFSYKETEPSVVKSHVPGRTVSGLFHSRSSLGDIQRQGTGIMLERGRNVACQPLKKAPRMSELDRPFYS